MIFMSNITNKIFGNKEIKRSIVETTTRPSSSIDKRGKRFLISLAINDFARNPDASLRGCEPDSKNYVNFCVGRGFSETYRLVGENATLSAFENLMGDVAKLAVAGDRVVIHISSHGCQIKDKFNDEVDGKTEATCFYDFMDGGLMSDNHFNEMLSKFAKGVLIEVTKDTCHSRDSTRFAAFTDSD
jgi:Caspase domain